MANVGNSPAFHFYQDEIPLILLKVGEDLVQHLSSVWLEFQLSLFSMRPGCIFK